MSEEKKKDPLIEWLLIIGALIVLYLIIANVLGAFLAKWWWEWQYIKSLAFGVFWENGAVKTVQQAVLQDIEWGDVSVFQSLELAGLINRWWWFLTAPIVIYVAREIAKGNPLADLKHKHDMDSLLKSESRIWPHMLPILKLNVLEASTKQGRWQSGPNPFEYATKYKLFTRHNGEWTTEVDKEKVMRVFTAQLTDVWNGVDALPPIYKAFFAIFAAQGVWDGKNPKYAKGKDDARRAINALAISFFNNSNKLDYSWVEDMLQKYADHPQVKKITLKHAYTHTMMMSMLEFARKNGVLASSEFFWLRAVDRKLWYSLNNVGRNVAWTEVAGIYGHWLAEKVSETALVRPYVQKAVEAYADGLKNIKITKEMMEKFEEEQQAKKLALEQKKTKKLAAPKVDK
jgi:intracellular multiplication protein IcmP